MTRTVLAPFIALLLSACGGGATPTRTSAPPATTRPTAAATTASDAEKLCFLTPADWQQFNYVTSSKPTVTSDGPGTAICQYASGLFLEVYADSSETDSQATFQTILENVPFDGAEDVNLPATDEAQFDADIGDNHAGMAVRAGKLSFLVTGLSRDEVKAELALLAGLVLTRSAALQ